MYKDRILLWSPENNKHSKNLTGHLGVSGGQERPKEIGKVTPFWNEKTHFTSREMDNEKVQV